MTGKDRLTRERRSWNMSRIRGKNTSPELIVRRLLHRMGYRFRLHVKNLPGKPDIVLPKYKTVIFVHGCFWHRHKGCKNCTAQRIGVQSPSCTATFVCDKKSPRNRATSRVSRLRARSCSQIRTTRQPLIVKVRRMRRSLMRLSAIFWTQAAPDFVMWAECFRHPCQKQPSTKRTSLCLGKTKSGVPGNRRWRLHPVIRFARKSRISASSVVLLPRARMLCMIALRDW